MEHIVFEVQVCIEMLIFKEQHVFDVLINLCLATSLHLTFPVTAALAQEQLWSILNLRFVNP